MVRDHCARRRFDHLPQRVPRSLVDLLDRIDLCPTKAALRLISGALQRLSRIRENIDGRIECPLAHLQVVDDAIVGSVETIAGLKDGAGEELLISDGKSRIQDRTAVWQRLYGCRSDIPDRLYAPIFAESDRL
jgi:hypothetical protein